MQPIKIQPIKKTVSILVGGDKVSLPRAIRQDTDRHWQKLAKDNPRLFNGVAFTVLSVEETNEKIDITLAETDYAHYLYSHQVGGLGDYAVRVLHSATLVISADNKLIFGAMGRHTSRPGIIQCCGGGIDNDDITDGVVDIEHNTIKELAEELGLDSHDESLVAEFYPAYLKTGGPRGIMTLAYALHLKLPSLQFLRRYEEFAKKLKDEHEEPEFERLFCIDRDKKSVEAFIKQHQASFDEYMPALLRVSWKARA